MILGEFDKLATRWIESIWALPYLCSLINQSFIVIIGIVIISGTVIII